MSNILKEKIVKLTFIYLFVGVKTPDQITSLGLKMPNI